MRLWVVISDTIGMTRGMNPVPHLGPAACHLDLAVHLTTTACARLAEDQTPCGVLWTG